MRLWYLSIADYFDKRCLGAMWQTMMDSTGIGLGYREDEEL